MSAPAASAPAAASPTEQRAPLYHFIGMGWLVYWMTNSYIWMADVVPAFNFYVVTGLFLLYFSIARPLQVMNFVMRPGLWAWALTAIIPALLYFTDSQPNAFAYHQMRERIVFFALIAGSGLVMADRDGPRLLRRAAGISLAVAIVVNFAEFFVENPYNRSGSGNRSAGFYADPNISGAAIGTLLLLYLPLSKQTTRSLVITGFAYLATIATLSRSGILFATGLIGAYLFLPRGPGTMNVASRMTIGIGGLFAVLLGGVLAVALLDIDTAEAWRLRSAFTLDVSDVSAQSRFDRAAFAFDQAMKYFWTGRGPGASDFYNVSAHNAYLTILYDYGVLGLLFFVGAITTGFLKVTRFGWARASNYFFMALQLAYYSNFAHTVQSDPIFAVMFAAFLTNAALEPVEARAADPARRSPTGSAPAGRPLAPDSA